MARKTVSVLGCGWLGFPLAKNLLKQGYKVKGSTTTPEKLMTLRAAGIEPYLVNCEPQINADDIEGFLDADVLFLNIPFKKNLADPQMYRDQIEAVLLNLAVSPVSLLVFASSTSIYPETNGTVTEKDEVVGHNARSKALVDIEDRLMMELQFESTVVRFAGMYGEGRWPGSTRGPVVKEHADAPMNLIHLDDCVKIISEIIQVDCRGEVFNACADEHPKRKDVYVAWSQKRGEEPPQFSNEEPLSYKVVSNEKFKRRFSYNFLHPNPLLD